MPTAVIAIINLLGTEPPLELHPPIKETPNALNVGSVNHPHLRGVPYAVSDVRCPMCGEQMRLIAFITQSTGIRQILEHIRADSQPPHISPACGPALWEDRDAQMG